MSMTDGSLTNNSARLQMYVDELTEIVHVAVEHHTAIHEVEKKVLKTLLDMGYATLKMLVERVGSGDVGEVVEPDGKKLKRIEPTRRREYTSIFGTLSLQRYVYAKRKGAKITFVPVDARLGLPESKFSYLLQDWDQSIAMEEPFEKVGKLIERILGLEQHVDSVERMNRQMAQTVDDFHAQQTAPPPSEERAIVVQTADGKGVPIRRDAKAAKIESHRSKSGPQPGAKRMATLGAVYTVDPYPRTPEQIVEALFRQPGKRNDLDDEGSSKQRRPEPKHKRVRALLNHTDANGDEVQGVAAIFGWLAEEVAARTPLDESGNAAKTIVSIMDGQESLWNTRDVFQPNVTMVDILDLLHVTPRLWSAANLFHDAGSDAAIQFVRARVTRILRGEVSSVIAGLRRLATTHNLRGKQLEKLTKVVNYFSKNSGKMQYDKYLAAGYPIASGVIEGACRHVVKDRLERTGMTWTIDGAQSMLSLRCIHLGHQWNDFIEFRIAKQTQRLYPKPSKLLEMQWAVTA